MKKIAVALASIWALALNGCSGGFGTMDGIMSSWQGAPMDAVITQWGYPHDQKSIAGKKIYVWYKNVTLSAPMTTTGTANVIGNTAYFNAYTTGGGTSEWNCTRILEVDQSEIVTSWQWEGNNCPFAEAFQYANWRRKN